MAVSFGDGECRSRATVAGMNIAVVPWTAERFLAWVPTQEGRYEYDGFQPVAMTRGTAGHSRITLNIHAALRSRLRGTPCSSFGPDLGVRTIGDAIRYPEVLVTCAKFPRTDLVAPDVRVVFEVLSADSGRRDRIEKVREIGVEIPLAEIYEDVDFSEAAAGAQQ
jgi:Uma2 family endonuclease